MEATSTTDDGDEQQHKSASGAAHANAEERKRDKLMGKLNYQMRVEEEVKQVRSQMANGGIYCIWGHVRASHQVRVHKAGTVPTVSASTCYDMVLRPKHMRGCNTAVLGLVSAHIVEQMRRLMELAHFLTCSINSTLYHLSAHLPTTRPNQLKIFSISKGHLILFIHYYVQMYLIRLIHSGIAPALFHQEDQQG